MSDKVFIAGVGMIPFMKPGTSPHYHVMAAQAITEALEDAGLAYEKVQQAFAGYVSGNSTCGQKAIYRVGMTGIPIFNVNNNCAIGLTVLFLARQAVASGVCEVALAVGFEQMTPGAISTPWTDRPVPLEDFNATIEEVLGTIDIPPALRLFGAAGLTHMKKYGTKMETFAAIRAKASRHAANNPKAVFRSIVSVEDVMNEKVMWPGVMTRSMACPPTCGAAAAIRYSMPKRPSDKGSCSTAAGVTVASNALTSLMRNVPGAVGATDNCFDRNPQPARNSYVTVTRAPGSA